MERELLESWESKMWTQTRSDVTKEIKFWLRGHIPVLQDGMKNMPLFLCSFTRSKKHNEKSDKAKMRHTEHYVWKCSSNKQCILSKWGWGTYIGRYPSELAEDGILHNVKTCLYHRYSQYRIWTEGKGTQHVGSSMWKKWWIYSGIYWTDCFELFTVIPW